VNNTELVDLEVDLAGFNFAYSFGNVHRHRTRLGVRHQAAGTQNAAQRTHLAHDVRRGDDDIHVGPAAFDLLDVFVQTDVIGTGGLGLLLLFRSAEHQHAHRLTRTVGQRHDAAHHLIRLAGIDAQTDVDVDRSIEFRKGNFLQKSCGLSELVRLVGLDLRVGIFLIFR